MANLNAWALTTVADVKESLGIDSGDSTKNNLIIRKINQATDMIEAYCGKNNSQHFASTAYTNEEYNGTGTGELVLRNRPLISLTSVQGRNTTENESSWTDVDTNLYFVDNSSGTINSLSGFHRNWSLYNVTYTAGFATIPSDLAEACVSLAGYLVENSSTGSAVKKKDQGPKSIEYFQPTQGESLFTQLGIDDVLSRYVDYPLNPDV